MKETDGPRSIDTFYDNCYQNKNSKFKYWLIFISLGISNSGDASEVMCMNYLFGNEVFREEILEGDLEGRGAKLAGAVYFGMFIGGILNGAIGDEFGRRIALLTGLFLNAISGVFACLTPSFNILTILRFFSGLGIGAIVSTFSALAIETAPPSRRGFFVVFVSSFWTFGTIYTSLLAFVVFGIYDTSWRLFMLGVTAPIICAFVMVYTLVPESSRYLALKGQHKDAVDVANRVAYSMGHRGRLLEESEIYHHFPLEFEPGKIEKKSLQEVCADAVKNVSYLYVTNLCFRTLMIQLIFALIAFGSGVSMWINTLYDELDIGSTYFSLVLYATVVLPANVGATYFIDIVGRKFLMVFGFAGASFSLFILSWVLSLDSYSSLGIVISSCCFHICSVIVYPCTVFVLTNEMFPTSVRNTAMGICTGTSRLCAVITQFLYASLITRPAMLSSLVSVILLFASLCTLAIPDMTNKPLSDEIDKKKSGKEIL